MSGARLAAGRLPPWDCSVIHFKSDPGHTDVLLRCSHSIGDGQLFMQLLKDILDEDPDFADEDGGTPRLLRGVDGVSLGGSESDLSMGSFPGGGGCFEGGGSFSNASSLGGAGGSMGGGGSTSMGGGSTSGGGRSCGSPMYIKAVHHNAAFLPPPSVERAARERELRARRQQQRRIKGERAKRTLVQAARHFAWK
jgi:hypothetical protein